MVTFKTIGGKHYVTINGEEWVFYSRREAFEFIYKLYAPSRAGFCVNPLRRFVTL